tara:strand:- start:1247 stop:1744 length:498 start_codon:yes stop_codon:yes gene_type:complete
MPPNLTRLKTVLFLLILGFIISCNDGKKDKKGALEKEKPSILKSPGSDTATNLASYMTKGKKVYSQYCLVCHQSSGSGVSGLNPPLKETEYVLGSKDRLLGIILNGSNVGLSIKGTTYSNAMPGFGTLSDEDIANVASYIRNSFGNSAEPITPEEVTGFRSTSDL